MEYVSKIDNDICTVIDTKTKQEKCVTKADLKKYVLQGNEVCGVNAREDLFYELQIIGTPKTITKSKLGYKPKRISDSPIKYVINLLDKNEKIHPELEENYVSFDAEIYSIRRGFLDREVCNDLLIPKWNKTLPILLTEWKYYREIAINGAFIVLSGLKYSLEGGALYSSKNMKKVKKILPIIEKLGKDLPVLRNVCKLEEAYYRKACNQADLDEVGGMAWLEFYWGKKFLAISDNCLRYPSHPPSKLWQKLKEFVEICNVELGYDEIDSTPKDIGDYLYYWKYFSKAYPYGRKECIAIGQEVPPLWEVVPCLVDIKADDIVLTGVKRADKYSGVTYSYLGTLIEKKVSVVKELKNTKSDVLDITCLDGVWQIDRRCFEDWLHRGRLAIGAATAKRAILGLGDFEMDTEFVLHKLSAGRNGDFVVPEGCKKVEKGAIVLGSLDCKVKFCDSVKACKTGIFTTASYTVGGTLTIDLANLGYKVVYSIGRSLRFLEKRTGRFEVNYIFSEEMFVEQAVALMVSVEDSVYFGFRLSNNEFAFGKTNVNDKMNNPEIVRKIRELIANNGLKLDYAVGNYLDLAEGRANRGV